MKKQTAVEWLLEEWPILESQIPPRIIDQAKAMEKEQIIEAYEFHIHTAGYNAEEFYNEIYGK